MLPLLATGASSEVFAFEEGKVLKAFYDIAPAVRPDADPTLIPRIAFAAELHAYRQIAGHPDLEKYVPRFYGEVDPRSLSLETTRSYASGCGLVLERIPGKAVKLSKLPSETLPQVESVVEEMMETLGLDYPWDSSCFVPGTRAAFTVIAFATQADRLAELDEILAQWDYVPEHLLSVLGL